MVIEDKRPRLQGIVLVPSEEEEKLLIKVEDYIKEETRAAIISILHKEKTIDKINYLIKEWNIEDSIFLIGLRKKT